MRDADVCVTLNVPRYLMTSSTKRPRSASLSSSDSSLSLPPRSSSPATKYIRFPQDQSEIPSLFSSVVCTLPPTCSLPNRPTHLNSLQEAESHYANYHTHVCEYPKCRCVFPDTRLLELVSHASQLVLSSVIKFHPYR